MWKLMFNKIKRSWCYTLKWRRQMSLITIFLANVAARTFRLTLFLLTAVTFMCPGVFVILPLRKWRVIYSPCKSWVKFQNVSNTKRSDSFRLHLDLLILSYSCKTSTAASSLLDLLWSRQCLIRLVWESSQARAKTNLSFSSTRHLNSLL